MSLLSIKSHSCLQKVTSVGKKSILFVPVIAFTWKPYLQLKKRLVLPKVTSARKMNISKMSITYQEKRKSIFSFFIALIWFSRRYTKIGWLFIFTSSQHTKKKIPSFRKKISSGKVVNTQGNRILRTLKLSRKPCQECTI